MRLSERSLNLARMTPTLSPNGERERTESAARSLSTQRRSRITDL